MTVSIFERLDALPPKLTPEARIVYAEATGPEQLAVVAAHRIAKDAAGDAAMAWIKSKGGTGFYPPRTNFANGDDRPTEFTFAEKPTGRAWKNSSRRPPKGVAVRLARTTEGVLLNAEREALPAFPNEREIIDMLGVPDSINYTNDKGRGNVGVGREGYTWYFATLARVHDRFLVGFPNPFRAIQLLASEGSAGLVIEDEAFAWHPPEGWTLRSNAEVELIAAQARADEEAKAAA